VVVQQGSAVVGEPVLVADGVGRQGGRHGCPVVGEAVLVAEAVLVGAGVGGHGGRHGGPVVGEAVLVGEAAGSHGEAVLVGVGWAGSGSVGWAGSGSVGWAGSGSAGWVVAGCGGAWVAGVRAGFEPVALVEPGLPGAALVGFVVCIEGRDATAIESVGVRAEAGSAVTPWRYASAMAVTMLT
jgi:hypothetical protein